MEASSELTWSGEAQEKAKEHSESVRFAIGDVHAVASLVGMRPSDKPLAVLVDEEGTSVRVLILVPGLLHDVRGMRDERPWGSGVHTQQWSSECSYTTRRITPEWTYTLRLKVDAIQDSRRISQEWVFQVGEEEPLRVRVEVAPRESLSQKDPLVFARALAAEIARVRASGAR